ncbi:MAG: slipin family protein [Candidatus Marinimicrobia bacterium]|nr:slipin family protein [Candidatus Neomarinimicrobiota bacterium]
MFSGSFLSIGTIIILLVMFLSSAIKILKEYERGVIFRLGRVINTKGPGLILLIPIIDKMVKVSLRTIVLDVPSQDIITKDNVSVKVNAVIYYRALNPQKAIVQVEDFHFATSQLAQTTLRSILGQSELDELLSDREKINHALQEIIDKQTDPWGIKVSNVEIKHVDLPVEMQRSMAKQAEAERERRAKVIAAEGEFQASKKLSNAAEILDKHPSAIQLRYLQTLMEISNENSTTTVFPIPLDIFEPFKRYIKKNNKE